MNRIMRKLVMVVSLWAVGVTAGAPEQLKPSQQDQGLLTRATAQNLAGLTEAARAANAHAEPVAAGKFQPSWESLQQYEFPAWFRDAKFGIWAHWGPQCQPEKGDWYARNMYSQHDKKGGINHVYRYQPDLLYFDDDITRGLPLSNDDPSVGLRIAAHLYNRSMSWHGGTNDALIAAKKLSPARRQCLLFDIERGGADEILPQPWQTDTCIGAWHYDHGTGERNGYKKASEVIRMLADIVSKNGNLLLLAPLAPLHAAETAPLTTKAIADGPFKPTVASLNQYQCPEWFRNAKFGIWSHWGPDSIPGLGNNYAHDLWRQGGGEYKWHLEHYGHPSKFGYKEVIESWKAEKFEPDTLVAKYKAAGAKYMVALATHHDNFDCFDSAYHEWNAVKKGPHKDIVGLWREAALKAGLRFGVSSHADERGWNYMYGARLADTTGPLAGVPYQGAEPAYESLYNTPQSPKDKPPEVWKQKWLKRHTDLVDKYHPDLLYFDGGIPHGQYGVELIAHYLNSNAQRHTGAGEGVVNVKAGTFVRDYERGVAPTLQEKPWQDDTSLSGWFYLNHNPRQDSHSLVKNAPTVIHTLADVVSKNGNLLMNFPQRGDGSLYPECEAVLDELAKWMPINGEAIFDTRPWTTFGEGPTVLAEKGMNELMTPMTSRDIRFTTKGKVLYALVLGLPTEAVRIKSLATEKIASITLLGSDAQLEWKQVPDALAIQPVTNWPCQHAVVFKITRQQQTPVNK